MTITIIMATAWTLLLEKLILSQSDSPPFRKLKIFPVFTSPYLLSIPEPDDSTPHLLSYFFKINFNIMFFSTSRYSKWPSFSFISQTPARVSLLPHMCHTPCILLLPWFYEPHIWWGVQTTKFIISLLFSWSHFFPASCCLLLLKPKYIPQHPILEHLQPVFLCGRSSFTPVQNNRKSYNYVCFNICISE